MAIPLRVITEYLDHLLNHVGIEDYSGARNGLHLENSGAIEHLFAAVDANVLTLKAAAAKPNSLLFVHHGLAWNGLCPLAVSYTHLTLPTIA